MARKNLEKIFADIDTITRNWQQGDCFTHQSDFFFKANPKYHIATDSLPDEDESIIAMEVDGLCVTSQTCDIVRPCKDRPYIEVSPLVKAEDSNHIKQIKKKQRPNRAYIPNLADQNLVVDLDRVMTIEKSCLKGISPIKGCNTDSERRAFAKSLSRKKERPAFPNDFIYLISNLRDKIKGKHNKNSNEGNALRALREIRIAASPSWQESEVSLNFYFIHSMNQTSSDEVGWNKHLEKWKNLLTPHGRFKNITCEVISLESLSAKEYVESDPMDLDYLSE